MSVDPNFDLNVLLNMVKSGHFRNLVYIMCWTGWEWRQMANASSVLSDSYVLNLSNLGRESAPPPTPSPSIVISPVPDGTLVSTSFFIQGSMVNYSGPTILRYMDDNSNIWNSMGQVAPPQILLSHPGLTAGTHTVTIGDQINPQISATISLSVITPTITVNRPADQATGQSFEVTGSLTGYQVAPTLQYSDATLGWVNIGTEDVTSTGFTFLHPSLPTGTQTITVRDLLLPSVSGTSSSFTVSGGTSLFVATPVNQVVGSPFAVTGTLTGYGSAPTLQYSVHNYSSGSDTGYLSLPGGSTVTSSTFSVSVPAQSTRGVYTVSVRDAGNTSKVGSTANFINTYGSVGIGGLSAVAAGNPLNNSLNIIVMGDGFGSGDDATILAMATSIKNGILSTAPFSSYTNKVNVYLLYTHSTQTGVSNDPSGGTPGTVNNYFGSAFSGQVGGGADRLLTTDTLILHTLALQYLPYHSLVVMVGNSTTYGGAGYAGISTMTLEPAGDAVPLILHEMGHSVFSLSDEYGGTAHWTGGTLSNPFGGTAINVAAGRSSLPLVWSSLLTTPAADLPNPNCALDGASSSPFSGNPVGLFESSQYYNCGLYRPQFACKMRSILSPHCAVCTQTMSNYLGAL